ncbi:MAG: hypothetical protein MJZ63_01130 [Muribaculaceae bacterium]|nr:hypothetical protein [Muribaculaceae bacterium]
MKKLLTNIVIVAALVITVDVLVGVVTKRLIHDLPDSSVLEADIVQAMENKKADILILGSSKAKHSFVPQIFTSDLHLSAYNAGCDGHDVVYASLVFDSFLQRCQPKIVVVGLWNSMLDGSWRNNSINNCKTLYNINESYTSWVDKHEDWTTRMKMQSNIYRFNSSLVWIGKSYNKGDQHSDGYSPLYEVPKEMSDVEFKGFKADDTEVNQLKHIIAQCNKKGIKIYIILAPDHEIDNAMRKWVADFCKKEGVWFHDYTYEKTIYPEITNFSDAGHLSDKGAQLFTKLFIANIQKGK